MPNNPACTTAQFFALYDVRTMTQLSGDQNAGSDAQASVIQLILDMQWSEFQSIIGDRYALPTVANLIPLVITKWVAVTSAVRMFARRNDRPKQLDADAKWAEDWTAGLLNGMYTIPTLEPAQQPILQDSDRADGSSRFDYVYGQGPSCTGPTGPGNAGGST